MLVDVMCVCVLHVCVRVLLSVFWFVKHLKKNKKIQQQALDKIDKLTWLVLGGDPAVRSRRVEQFAAL